MEWRDMQCQCKILDNISNVKSQLLNMMVLLHLTRASLGDLNLDWEAISIQAIAVMHSAMDDENADSTDV